MVLSAGSDVASLPVQGPSADPMFCSGEASETELIHERVVWDFLFHQPASVELLKFSHEPRALQSRQMTV